MSSYQGEYTGLAVRRELAASLATDLFANHSVTPDKWRAMAKEVFTFLGGPIVVTLIIGPVLDQTTGRPTGNVPKGSPMQIRDTEKVDFIVAEADVKGADVPDDPTSTLDDLTWTIDNDAVASLEVSSDTRTCTAIAGTPGSAVITVSTGNGLSATVALDVVPSDAVTLTVTAGAPQPQ